MTVYWCEPTIILDCQIYNDKVSDGGQLLGMCKVKVYPKEDKDMYICDYRLLIGGREAGKITIKVVNMGAKRNPIDQPAPKRSATAEGYRTQSKDDVN